MLFHQGEGADQPHEHGHINDPQGEHGASQSPAQASHKDKGQQQGGKGNQHIADPPGGGIKPAAEITRTEPQGNGDDRRKQDHPQRPGKGNPPAVEHPGKEVPAEPVRAENMGRRRGRQGCFQILIIGPVSTDEGRRQTGSDDQRKGQAFRPAYTGVSS